MDSLQLFNGTGAFQASSSELFYASSYDQVNQTYQQETTVIDHAVPGNRLVERTNGTFEVIPKTPAEVIGERVLRPAIDVTWYSAKFAFNAFHQAISAVDHMVKPLFNFPPGADATGLVTPEELFGKAEEVIEAIVKDGQVGDVEISRWKVSARFNKIETAIHDFENQIRDNFYDIQKSVELFEEDINALDKLAKLFEESIKAADASEDPEMTADMDFEIDMEDPFIDMEKAFIQVQKIANRHFAIVDDLLKLMDHSLQKHDELFKYLNSCENLDNICQSLKEILTSLDIKTSPYSPYKPSNFVLSVEPLSLRWNQSPMCPMHRGGIDSHFRDSHINVHQQFNNVVFLQLTLKGLKEHFIPSWLMRRPRSSKAISRLNDSLEKIKEDLQSVLKDQEMLIDTTFKKEEAVLKQKIPQLVMEIFEKQKRIVEQIEQQSHVTSMLCIVEKTINDSPVSWRFEQRGVLGTTPLFSFTYESNEGIDQDSSTENENSSLKDEL